MWNKGLWRITFKQAKLPIIAFIFITLFYPITFNNWLIQAVKNFKNGSVVDFGNGKIHHFLYFHSELPLFQALALLALIVVLQGNAKANQQMAFQLSLPINRRDLFNMHAFLGLAMIILFTSISHLITIFTFSQSMFASKMPLSVFWHYYLFILLSLCGMYLLALLVSQLVGNTAGIILLSVVISILPAGLFSMINVFVDTNLQAFNHAANLGRSLQNSVYDKIGDILLHFSLPVDITEFNIDYNLDLMKPRNPTPSWWWLAAPLVIGVMSYLIGVAVSRKPKAENYGRLLLYPSLHPYFLTGSLICFFLFGGYFFTSFFNTYQENPDLKILIIYYISGLVTAFVVYMICSRILGINFTTKRKQKRKNYNSEQTA